MKRLTLLILALFALALAVACEGDDEEGGTVATIQDRGELLCGVKQTQPLFGFKEADGTVTGFDIEFCKAIAAAVLKNANAVEYVDASDASTRFELLADETIDVLIRTTTITASRDRELEVDFAQTTFYTGQGFAVRTDSGYNTTSDMGEATICVQTGTTTEQNVADHFTDIGLTYDPKGGLSADVADAFFSGRCDVLTADASDLASRIAVRDDAADYKILPQIISKEPLAPGVRDNESEWKDVVNWVVHGLIAAEEARHHPGERGPAWPPTRLNTEVARLLGVPFEGGSASPLWASTRWTRSSSSGRSPPSATTARSTPGRSATTSRAPARSTRWRSTSPSTARRAKAESSTRCRTARSSAD